MEESLAQSNSVNTYSYNSFHIHPCVHVFVHRRKCHSDLIYSDFLFGARDGTQALLMLSMPSATELQPHAPY